MPKFGLDTHEKMTIENLDEKKEIRSRQLVVLAGDFYSSLYYFSLSRQGDIQMVKWIAEAIQEFNVHKCHLFYPSDSLNWEQKYAALERIESALVTKIAAKLGFLEWVPALSDYFLFKRLTIERNCFLHKSGTFPYFFTFSKIKP
ncbi:heptaprenyl diphosphate synthase component 1 [Terrilactibacillus sp. S3-3]|nr:heptaprenyl diphosphate synthase component 1 [Terrilactibacillus sp. S3-3]